MRIMVAIAVLAAGAAHAQAAAYDAETLNLRAVVAYDAGDSVLAALLWRLAGKAGSADAMIAYGGLRAAGDGVAADPKDAMRWYARAARHGDAHAMVLLAESVARSDPKRSRHLYAQAAALGHAYAQHQLALPPGEHAALTAGGHGEEK